MADTAAQPPSTSDERMKPLLNRYELGRVLGHGNFAKVYHARDIRTGESVAIKALDKERILKSGLAAHIKREVAILRRVRHPNIVRLHEVMASKSKIYLVMELVRGGELFAKVAKGRLQEPLARRYFHQLISALAFCHARGVYHRDLKPENLLLDHNGDLKITDFGLSAVKEQIHQDGLFHTFCGTPAYVAPEILSRRGYDAAKADIWSCGVILFVLMAGYLPFHDANIMSMYRKIHKGEFRCPRWFSGDLARLLARILDTNPETRITLAEIMESRWFKKGFKPIRFYVEDDKVHSFEEESPPEAPSELDYDSDSSAASVASAPPLDGRGGRALPRPMSLNAFDIISFSKGFDLSPLFDGSGDGARFVSGAPVNKIVSKLEEIARLVSFTVRKKDCRVNLEGSQDGENGPLSIAAEIYELTPELVMVEVKKKGGDQVEYENFCNNRLKPELQKLMGRSASIYSDTE